MNKNKKILMTIIYSWFFVSSFACIIVDLVLSVTNPDGDPMSVSRSFENQAIYLSVWVTISVGIWGLLNIIELWTNIKWLKWASDKSNETFVISMSVVMFVVYLVTMLADRNGVAGFDTTYKIVKSSIEHFFNPVLLIVVYFALPQQEYSCKSYALRDGWFTLIFTTVYIVAMIIREAVVRHNSVDPWTPFPYSQMDPWTAKTYMWIISLIAIEFVPYGIGNLFNYLSNLSYRSLKKRYPNF